jgi:hypothetical protein
MHCLKTATQLAYFIMPTPAAARDKDHADISLRPLPFFKSVLNYKHHLPLHHGTLHFVHRLYLRIPYNSKNIQRLFP